MTNQLIKKRLQGLVIFWAACLLLILCPLALAEDTPSLPAQAVIDSPFLSSANLCNNPDDYFTPQAVYFNGTPLLVTGLSPTHGDYPAELLANGDERWAKVVIGKTDDFAGIEGFMPLSAIRFSSETGRALPGAILEGEAMVPLYQDNGLTEEAIGSYPEGTKVSILGWLIDWAQVEVDGKTGFMRQEALQLDADAAESVFAALPPFFDEIQPGHQAQYAQYTDELMALYTRYGDSNEWPLSVKAQASELAARYGFQFTPDVNLMPGENDLSEEEVLKIAKAAAKDAYGIAEDSWDRSALSFSYPEGEPQSAGWKINLWARAGGQDAVIWLDRKGMVTDSLLNDFPALAVHDALFPEETALLTSRIEYYFYGKDSTPGENVLDQQQAEDMAWAEFRKAYPQAGSRENYAFESRFLKNDEETLSWWLVSVLPPFPVEWGVRFEAALLAPAGETVYTTSPELFDESMGWAIRQELFEKLEQEQGPYNTWTLEQKADWDPDFYGLPAEDEIPMAQAISLARARITADFQLDEAHLDGLEEAVSFDVSQGRFWHVSYMTKGEAVKGEAWEYYGVFLDAKTGEIKEVAGPEGSE